MPDGSGADLDAVLRRWQPRRPDLPTVSVQGLPGSGCSTLTARLRAEVPTARFTDGPDPAADTVLVVFDAASVIGREELELLSGVARGGVGILLTMVRTDLHHDWHTVLGRDIALLAQHAPQLAGAILPVSAVTGSGLPELSAEVAARATGADPSRRHRTALEQTRRLMLATLADLRRDEGTTGLRERRATLIGQRDGPRTEAAAALRRLAALARVDLTHQVGERVRAISAGLRSELDRGSRRELPEFQQRVRDAVTELTVELDASTSATLSGVGEQVLGKAYRAAGPNRPPPLVAGPEARPRGVEDRMMIVVGASAGVGAGRFVIAPMSGIAGFDLIAIPATLLVGGGAAWWLTRMRGQVADRAHLRLWLAEVMAQVRSGLEQRALTRLVDTEAETAEAIARAHRQRIREVEESLTDLDRAVRESIGRTSGRLAAVERDLAVVERALAEPPPEALRPTHQ
ncbi:hypothetical protein ACFYVR_22785 [Rhodococcus sp. NPDC003318]|uniref:hypothetical protein n=1 Tax=Rhodococcus sp. NPDC003318 TaxID=3364503 RepID=UPI0036852434